VSVTPYQDTLVQTLEALGWFGTAIRPVFDAKAKRFLTPTTVTGWPDLTYIHPRTGVVLACEVKTNLPKGGHRGPVKHCGCCPRPDQVVWLNRWHQVLSAAAVVFRPADDWQAIARMLADPGQLWSGWGWLPEWRHPITVASAALAVSTPRPSIVN
jgi:hypothetical protein